MRLDDTKRTELEKGFEAWCSKLATALNGRLQPRNPESCNLCWRTIDLPEGGISLHLNTWENHVNVSGVWPRDHKHRSVSPRDALRDPLDKSCSINVGAERDPAAAAKDITRRFLPHYLQQLAALVEVVASRGASFNAIAANTLRLGKPFGLIALPTPNSGDEGDYQRSFWVREVAGLHTVKVRQDRAEFEVDLPLDQAEKVLAFIRALPQPKGN